MLLATPGLLSLALSLAACGDETAHVPGMPARFGVYLADYRPAQFALYVWPDGRVALLAVASSEPQEVKYWGRVAADELVLDRRQQRFDGGTRVEKPEPLDPPLTVKVTLDGEVPRFAPPGIPVVLAWIERQEPPLLKGEFDEMAREFRVQVPK